MHLAHHPVEMAAALVPNRQGIEEQVHQEGFAPAYATPEVDASRTMIFFAAAKKAPESSPGFLRGKNPALQIIEHPHYALLGRVCYQALGLRGRFVCFSDRHCFSAMGRRAYIDIGTVKMQAFARIALSRAEEQEYDRYPGT